MIFSPLASVSSFRRSAAAAAICSRLSATPSTPAISAAVSPFAPVCVIASASQTLAGERIALPAPEARTSSQASFAVPAAASTAEPGGEGGGMVGGSAWTAAAATHELSTVTR